MEVDVLESDLWLFRTRGTYNRLYVPTVRGWNQTWGDEWHNKLRLPTHAHTT